MIGNTKDGTTPTNQKIYMNQYTRKVVSHDNPKGDNGMVYVQQI